MGTLNSLLSRLLPDSQATRQADERQQANEQRMIREAERLLNEAGQRRTQRFGSKTAVIGLAAHYGVAELAPFVSSLRRSGYDGDVILLTYGCTADTAAFLRANRVRMLPFNSLAAMPMSMNSSRMYRYLDWFIELFLNESDQLPYGRVLLTDVRDVVFQGDPFTRTPSGRVEFFLESDRLIGNCPINRDWMERAYGAAVAQELANRPVSCAGTIMGAPDGLLEYLIYMVRDLVSVPPQHRFSGVDQAIHNHILARDLIPGSVAVANGGTVMTVPGSEASGITMHSDGSIVNPDGGRSPIVHQYDRDSRVNAAVIARYSTPHRVVEPG